MSPVKKRLAGFLFALSVNLIKQPFMIDQSTLSSLDVQLQKEIYDKSYYEFFKKAFNEIENGKKLLLNWHVKYLCDVLQEEIERIGEGKKRDKHLAINIPPRSLKSHLVSRCLLAWAWTKYPKMKFALVSYNSRLSSILGTDCKRLLESSWYQSLYPEIKMNPKQDEKTFYENTKGGRFLATGTGSSITGLGFDAIIIDDPINPQEAYSETKAETAKNYIDQTLPSRLDEPEVGSFFLVMQRLSELDPTAHLLKSAPEDYKHICIPAEYNEKVVQPPELKKYYDLGKGLFFPKRFTSRVLRTFRKRLGSMGYSNQYGQLSVSLDGGILKRKWFPIVSAESIIRDPQSEPINFIVDGAYTSNTENDPTAIISFFYRESEKRIYITNAWFGWKEFPDLIKFLKAYIPAHGYSPFSKIKIEPKASGKSIVQTLKNHFNVAEIDNKAVDMDKVSRVNSISPSCEAGGVALIEGVWNEDFLEEICAFPRGANDDQTDCLAYAVYEWLVANQNFGFGVLP